VRRPLLEQRRVIDDKKSCLIVNRAICLLQQDGLKRSAVPNSRSDEVMKLIVTDLASARRHRLNALVVSWTNQPGDMGWTHPRPRLVSWRIDERGKTPTEISLPVHVHWSALHEPTSDE